jgi:hypothetical protein
MNVTFDWNEWYFIISSLAALSVFIMIRSYFPLPIIILIWVYNIALVASIDYLLISTPFKVYYFGDNPTYELSGALFHLFMYPGASLLFLYIYDKWRLYGRKTVWLIACWTVLALFVEWLSVINHALVYTNWKLYYSIPTYPTASIVLIILYRFVTRKLQELDWALR